MDIMVLVYLLLIVVSARLMGELTKRMNQPPVVGELLAGIILGPFVLGSVFTQLNGMYSDRFIYDLADIGIVLLMLCAGLEISPRRFLSSSSLGAKIAVSRMIVPMSLAFIAGQFLGMQGAELVFFCIALSVTALPVTVRILKDMKILQTETGGRIVSAAMITDICLLFALGLLLIIEGGSIHSDKILFLSVGYALFFALSFVVILFLVPIIRKHIRWLETGGGAFAVAICIVISLVVMGNLIELPTFISAFVAGMILGEVFNGLAVWTRVKKGLSIVTLGFLAPIFFVLIGFTVDFGAVFGGDASAIMLFLVILAIALIGKIVGTVIPARKERLGNDESMAIGFMMMGKGAMELVFARTALEMGIIDQGLFSMLVLMAFISTVMAPIMFKYYFKRVPVAGRIISSSVKTEKAGLDRESTI